MYYPCESTRTQLELKNNALPCITHVKVPARICSKFVSSYNGSESCLKFDNLVMSITTPCRHLSKLDRLVLA